MKAKKEYVIYSKYYGTYLERFYTINPWWSYSQKDALRVTKTEACRMLNELNKLDPETFAQIKHLVKNAPRPPSGQTMKIKKEYVVKSNSYGVYLEKVPSSGYYTWAFKQKSALRMTRTDARRFARQCKLDNKICVVHLVKKVPQTPDQTSVDLYGLAVHWCAQHNKRYSRSAIDDLVELLKDVDARARQEGS